MAYRRTPNVEARLQAQREMILHAASHILTDGGYAACTVAAVAERAGIASGTVYNHFTNKSALVAELFRRHVTREVDAVRAASTLGTSLERTSAVIETFAGRALKHPRRAYALLAEPADPAVDQLRLAFRTAFRDVIADAIADGVGAGELPPQNPVVVAAALVGAIAEALIGPLATGTDDPETIPTLITFTHRAIGGHRVER